MLGAPERAQAGHLASGFLAGLLPPAGTGTGLLFSSLAVGQVSSTASNCRMVDSTASVSCENKTGGLGEEHGSTRGVTALTI